MFIKATKEFNTFDRAVAAPYLRKSFESKRATSGVIEITACGFYELYFNGRRITKGFLAPYISNTEHMLYVDKYEVEIEKGENVIGILLGNGLQNNPGGWIWDFDKYTHRGAPKVALTLSFDDVIIESDQSFKTHPSPISYDDYRYGEMYDANFEIEGWNEKGFFDDEWGNAILAEAPKGELRICEAEPIVKDFEIKPIGIFSEEDGFVYDFGVNHTGVCRLELEGKKGQKITLCHGEILIDGKFNNDMLFCDANRKEPDLSFAHKDIYVCKEGKQTYTPTFTYHGFRYVKVKGITEVQATPELLTFVVLHSALETRGDFSCSDEIANRLQEITRRSDISNFHYFPTDCPHREKNGWTADAALSAEQLLLNYGCEKSFAEWHRNICKAQNEKGAIPGIVPAGNGFGFDWGNGPAWDCVLVWLPYYVYMYRGEKKMIYESAEHIFKYLKYIEGRRDEKGLMHIGLGDWCHANRNEGDPKAPLVVTDSIISMLISERAAFLFDVIGRTEERDYAQNLAKEFKKAIRENLIDFDSMTVLGNCHTSQAMGIYYDVFTDEEKPKAFGRFMDFIKESDEHIDCGVLGGRIIFHLLSDYGYSDLAYKMITRKDFPSYGYWLEQGATTLWEAFYVDRVKSCNHHFWGDISAWFIKQIAGINYNPKADDIKYLEIKPNFIDGLKNASAFYDGIFGRISSEWHRDGQKVILNLEIPKEINTKIILPKGYFINGEQNVAAKSGEYIISKQEKDKKF